MYLWELVGCDPTEDPPRSGIGGDLGPIMRTVEEELAERPGCGGRVTEVVRRLSVAHLVTVHVPTGREWLACRDRHGTVYWEARLCHPDPDAATDAKFRGAPAAS
jgi:hypothetical protein